MLCIANLACQRRDADDSLSQRPQLEARNVGCAERLLLATSRRNRPARCRDGGVPDHVDPGLGLHRFRSDSERRGAGQVSLPEAHLELTFERRGAEAELKVVDLGRPARLLHRPVRVDLAELGGATVACGHSLIRDLSEASPGSNRNPRIRAMSRTLLRLEHGSVAPARVGFRQTGYSYRASAPRQWSFGFEFYDEHDLLLCPGAS